MTSHTNSSSSKLTKWSGRPCQKCRMKLSICNKRNIVQIRQYVSCYMKDVTAELYNMENQFLTKQPLMKPLIKLNSAVSRASLKIYARCLKVGYWTKLYGNYKTSANGVNMHKWVVNSHCPNILWGQIGLDNFWLNSAG